MHRAELYTMLDKLYKKLNIKKRGIHILRHTFGKRMVKKNVNLSTIKELMGHENIQTTMIYARSDERGMIRAVSS
jgi:integrase/recombinase XerD